MLLIFFFRNAGRTVGVFCWWWYAQKGQSGMPKRCGPYVQMVLTATPKRCRAVGPNGAERYAQKVLTQYNTE